MLDLVVRGGIVVDGTGAPGERADVGVLDGRIVAVGAVDERATRTIDATDLVVAPGFVDLHTHYDAQLFWDPLLSPSSDHGVTTVIAGNCGLTLAPAAPDDRDFLTRLLARVESIPVEAMQDGVEFSWSTYAEFLDVVEATPRAVNIGFMVGHSALRRAVMSEGASADPADADQVAAMCRLLSAAIAAGGLGLSTANAKTQVDGDGRPTPPNYATRDEFVALARICGQHPGTSIEFIPDSFIRGFTDADIDLLAEMSVAADRPVNWNTPLVNNSVPDLHRRQLAATDVAHAHGGWLVPMFMPQNVELQHDFLRGYVFRALPGWAPLFDLKVEDRIGALSDPTTRRRLEELAAGETEGLAVVVRNWANYRVNEVADPALRPLVGRRIGDLATEWGMSPFDAMIEVAIRGRLDVGFVRTMYTDGDEWSWKARLEVLTDPRVLLQASDAGAHLDMMSGADFPTRCIAELVRDRGVFTIEELVHQFSDRPARLYGLTGRGRIEVGAWADLVIFDPATVGSTSLQTVRDLPSGAARLTTRSTGVSAVIVSGQPVMESGVPTGELSGRLVRSGRDTTTVPASLGALA